LYDFVEQVFLTAGVDETSAKDTARGLWFASLRGVDSHGVRLLPHYLKAVQLGRINAHPVFTFNQTSPSTGLLDADHGFGIAAGICAIHHAVALAKEAGTGQVAVFNSNHCGSMATFALEACKEDMIGTAYTNATPKMRTPNATTSFFGTNPICLAAPMASEDPFCYDGSTTVMSANKIRVYGERGLKLPSKCGAGEDGNETIVPADVTQLLPIGDYKGFGMAMIVDLLCGLLTGMPAGDEVTEMFNGPPSDKRYLGQFYGAQRIDAFQDAAHFKSRLQAMAERIREQPRLDTHTPVQVPGDPEKAFQLDREKNGIPISDRDQKKFDSIARELNIDAPFAAE
jgi:LDH2 family malate/lactate/ureidoglycolate dehydrogenase